MDNQLEKLRDRISMLERQSRLFKRLAGVSLAILLVVVGAAARGVQSSNTIEAQSILVIKNLLKQNRITPTHALNGSWLIIQDLNGNERVRLGTDNSNNGVFQLKLFFTLWGALFLGGLS